jgi:hypothetical protein
MTLAAMQGLQGRARRGELQLLSDASLNGELSYLLLSEQLYPDWVSMLEERWEESGGPVALHTDGGLWVHEQLGHRISMVLAVCNQHTAQMRSHAE